VQNPVAFQTASDFATEGEDRLGRLTLERIADGVGAERSNPLLSHSHAGASTKDNEMKYPTFLLSTLVAFGGTQVWAQSNAISAQNNDLSSIAISGTGIVLVTPRIGPDAPGNSVPVDNNPAGLAYVAGNESFIGNEISPTDSIPSPGSSTVGPTSIAFYTLTSNAVAVADGIDAAVIRSVFNSPAGVPLTGLDYPAPGDLGGLTSILGKLAKLRVVGGLGSAATLASAAAFAFISAARSMAFALAGIISTATT